ncbi:MAG TPA: hypothetical protein VHO01_08265 [Jatrophihabitans sp.]|nr:hypothetical protein [Jatrophihabitans sp.]
MPEPLRRAAALAAWGQAQRTCEGAGLAPELMVAVLLDADDEYGRGRGLVVVADRVSWSMLDALLDMALYGSLSHKRDPHPPGGAGCRWCQQAQAMWHAALITPLTAARGITATQLHEQIRRAVGQADDVTGPG